MGGAAYQTYSNFTATCTNNKFEFSRPLPINGYGVKCTCNLLKLNNIESRNGSGKLGLSGDLGGGGKPVFLDFLQTYSIYRNDLYLHLKNVIHNDVFIFYV